MDGSGFAHLGVGHQLACHENRRHRFPAPDFSDAVHVAGHTRAGAGLVGHESAVSHRAQTLARVVGAGGVQHVFLARPDHRGGAVAVQRAGRHLGLHHAHVLGAAGCRGVWRSAVTAGVGRRGGSGFGRSFAFVARTLQPERQARGRAARFGRGQHLGLGHATAASHHDACAHIGHFVLDGLDDHGRDDRAGLRAGK